MADDLTAGLYERLITEALAGELDALADELVPDRSALHPAEAADRIALHLAALIERAVDSVDDKRKVDTAVTVARELIARLDELVDRTEAARHTPVDPGEVLRALQTRQPDGQPRAVPAPLIPLLDTTLLTNAPDEPNVGHQIETEIRSADRIDVVMAFIRRSGIRPLVHALEDHRGQVRVLTTTYTGSTEQAALDQLVALGADVRVSYDTTATRLHAKAWLFHRNSGYSTAYIGSSNLTHSAQRPGLEWNVRVSQARNRDVLDKVGAVFESYWESGDFRLYDPDEFAERTETRDPTSTFTLSPIELRPEPFQDRLLEQIDVARSQGHHRNLLVSATGTGKTVMAALDYARLRTRLPRARLLVVAHRQEILDQSHATFAHALRDADFGEKWVGGAKPSAFEHVFASIQSLNAAGYDHLDPDHFDVVIVDEFHHAAAASYERLLDHVRPVELLGLTATPERADGLPILHWFDNRIAAELRLWDAIDQQRLTPFDYYGIHDGLDLRDVPWRRGRGYDVEGLTNVYTADDAWARRVVKELADHVDDPTAIRALGFCVSVEHAHFMARHFQEAGIPSVAVWADTADTERRAALADLAAGRVAVVFSVDLFNEGVDVPAVDTLLMLRPTESPTLFLQQLGRGLRRAEGKTACTVLDFVGLHRREFRFDRKYRALLGGTRQDLVGQIDTGFPYLPAGCHMELDAVASDEVLRSIRDAIPDQWRQKVEELRVLRDAGHAVTMANYLDHTGLDLDDLYRGGRSWSDLCEAADVPVLPAGADEIVLRRGIGRLLHLDDEVRLARYREILEVDSPPDIAALGEADRRRVRMLVASIAGQVLDKTTSLDDAVALLWRHGQVRAELVELFGLLAERVDHLHHRLATYPDVPLEIHGRYTRVEILAAFGVGDGAKVAPWQTGVRWIEEADADLFAFTLDKTSGNFSPTTRYRDYAISRELIHWESQSVTRADSETGRRYQQHEVRGSSVMLFARLRNTDRAFWFLGPAIYVRHESEQPMQVTWRLQHPLPGDLFASFAAAVA